MSTTPDEILAIDTPENVVFDYEVAGIGSRFMAALIDTTLIVTAEVIVYFTLIMIVSAANLDSEAILPGVSWTIAIMTLAGFAIFWGYYIVFELLWNGQSPGKRVIRLRVIRADGTSVTLVDILIRNLVRIVDFLPSFYGIGLTTMFIDRKSRRLGDLAAGTLVVFVRSDITLDSLAVKSVPRLSNLPVDPVQPEAIGEAAIPLNRLSDADLSMIEDYFRRRAEISHREKLGLSIARTVSGKLALAPAPATLHEAERLMARIIEAYRAT